jgi:hypothetical protein
MTKAGQLKALTQVYFNLADIFGPKPILAKQVE